MKKYKKKFFDRLRQGHLTSLTAAIYIRSNRARPAFVDFLTHLTNLTAKKQKSFIIYIIHVHIVIFYWSNWSNRSKNEGFCGVAVFVHRSNNLCCGQKPRLRAEFIGQTALTAFVCTNCYKLDACFILSTLRVSSLRPCMLTDQTICQVFTHAHARGGGVAGSDKTFIGPLHTPKFQSDANDENSDVKIHLTFV